MHSGSVEKVGGGGIPMWAKFIWHRIRIMGIWVL
jgi:hypothetical protein